MRRIIRLSMSVAVLGAAGFVLLFTSSIYTYHVLTDETLIAEVEFDRVGPREFVATLRTGDFCREQPLTVLGDQWRIDAQFLKWHYWAALLGLESRYRLERFEGRYRDVDQQNTAPTLAHALAEPSAIDIGGLAENMGRLNFLADASYGSSTYHDIDPTRTFYVYKSPTGIFTRSAPRFGPQVDGAPLAVDVRHGCGDDPGVAERTAAWINTAVDRVD